MKETTDERTTGSGWLRTVASALVPGLGHIGVTPRRRSTLLLGISALVVLPAAVLLLVVVEGAGRSLAVDIARPVFEHPWLLIGLLIVNVGSLGFRVWAAWDVHRATTRGTITAPVALLAIVTSIVVVVPHAWAAERTLALHDVLTHDYSLDPSQTTTTTLGSTSVSTTPAPTTTRRPTTTVVSTTTSSVATTTTTSVPATTTTTIGPPALTRRVNVLLLGGDAAFDRPGLRTDTMIVASVDPDTGGTVLMGVPRNQVRYPIPRTHPAFATNECGCFEGQSNTIYQYGLEHPELFPGGPNPGANAAMTIIGHTLGVELHHYALVDLQGFVEVIDALGGVEITVTQWIIDEDYTHPDGEIDEIEIRPGTHHMDGLEALAYARVRRHTDDYHRMGRQRCVLEAVAAQADVVTVMQHLPALADALTGSLVTDIPVREWPDFVELAGKVDTDTLVSIRFMPDAPELRGTPDSYIAGIDADGFWILDLPTVRSAVRRALTQDPATAMEDLGVAPLEAACG